MAITIITVATTTTSSRIEEGSIEEEGGVSEEDLLEGTRGAGMLHLHRRGYQVRSYAMMTYGLLCYVYNE